MKKLLSSFFIIIFPYFAVFLTYSVTNETIMEKLFGNNIYIGFFWLIALWVIALINAVIVTIFGVLSKSKSKQLAKTVMLVKLLQIPAYIAIFAVGMLCLATIFTVFLSVLLLIVDVMTILLSGLIGVSSVKNCYSDGVISYKESIIFGLLQFVFCIDVVISIVVYVKAKKCQV